MWHYQPALPVRSFPQWALLSKIKFFELFIDFFNCPKLLSLYLLLALCPSLLYLWFLLLDLFIVIHLLDTSDLDRRNVKSIALVSDPGFQVTDLDLSLMCHGETADWKDNVSPEAVRMAPAVDVQWSCGRGGSHNFVNLWRGVLCLITQLF